MENKLPIHPEDNKVTLFESQDGKCGISVHKDGSAEMHCEGGPLILNPTEVNMIQGISEIAIKSNAKP